MALFNFYLSRMKVKQLAHLVAFATSIAFSNLTFAQKSMDIKEVVISISGAEPVQSKVFIALYKGKDAFLESEELLRELDVNDRGEAGSISLSLKTGMYALAIFQDLNGNGILDKNMLGIPSEPYGFTNYEGVQLTPPTWNKTSFYLDSNREIVIGLK